MKTAQVWEATRGLPVRRLPGPRVQVRANRAELDSWKTATPVPLPAAPSAEKQMSHTTWWLLFGSLAAVLVGAAGFAVGMGAPALASAKIVDDALVGLDREGMQLWRHAFASLDAVPYKDGDRRLWVGNLDGDGQPDVLFVPIPHGFIRESVPLVRLDAQGHEIWRFTPGRSLRRGTQEFSPPYVVRQFAIIGDKVIVTSHHHLYYPSEVAVLDVRGRMVRSYYHPGHLNVLTTGTVQGNTVALLGGVNNLAHAATLVALDPARLDGAAIIDDRPSFDGLAAGLEIARILFPRSCISRHDPYNVVINILANPKEVIVHVQEELSGTHASVQYHLGPTLELASVSLSDIFRSKHQQLRADRILDHDADKDVLRLAALTRPARRRK
ncbi:MAG: hypothetical protein SFV54_25090 [Bryobacteraceae bacterium]|nr:hypothetical protein [Bryobacteraceae bacterium]